MADAIKTIKENTKKLLKMGAAELFDQVHFFNSVEKIEEDAFKPDANGYSPGDTVSIKIPTHWLIQEDDFDITGRMQDIKERSVDLPLDMSSTIPFDLDTEQLATDVDLGKVYERFIQPAIYDMAANIEARMLTKATQYTANLVGTAGSTIVDYDTVLSGRTKMNKFLCPKKGKDRYFLLEGQAMQSAMNSNKNLFVFDRKEYLDGYLGEAAGLTWLENELIYNHTNGNDVTGVAVEDSVVTIATGMSTLGVDGVTANTGTITKGTVFTIDGVYAVHPQRKTAYNFLKQFVHVGANATANASGQITLTLDEPIYGPTSGSLQNVSALPSDEGAITFVGSASTTYTQSLQFHKKAFRVCSVPLYMPKKAELAEQVSEQGINLALIKDFDVLTRKQVTRLDFLGGLVAVRPRHACRVTS